MLFNLNIEPSCAYCRNGEHLGAGEIACILHGIVDTSGYCGRFRYEPTKRVPEIGLTLDVSGFSDEDFSLDTEDENAVS